MAMVHSVARRPVRGTIGRVVVSVALVPLLVAKLPPLLLLVFPQFLAISVHVSLALVVVAQAIPFGSPVLPVRVLTPIACAVLPIGILPIGNLRASRAIIHGRR